MSIYPRFTDSPPPFGSVPSKGRPSTWRAKLDLVRTRPNTWAVVPYEGDPKHLPSLACKIKSGKVTGASPGEFDARTLKGELWVRFVGEAPRTLLQEVAEVFDTYPADIPEGLREAVLSRLT